MQAKLVLVAVLAVVVLHAHAIQILRSSPGNKRLIQLSETETKWMTQEEVRGGNYISEGMVWV